MFLVTKLLFDVMLRPSLVLKLSLKTWSTLFKYLVDSRYHIFYVRYCYHLLGPIPLYFSGELFDMANIKIYKALLSLIFLSTYLGTGHN